MEVRFKQRFLPSAWIRYAVGLALFGLALAARLAFATFYPAVVLTMYLCGVGPGALVAAPGALAGVDFFSPPHYAWNVDLASRLAALAFLFASTMTGWAVYRVQATALE